MWSDVVEAETILVPAVVPGVVAVIGLGQVGLPLAVQCAARGWRVLGCDANPRVVECVNGGRAPLNDEPELESELPRWLSAVCSRRRRIPVGLWRGPMWCLWLCRPSLMRSTSFVFKNWMP